MLVIFFNLHTNNQVSMETVFQFNLIQEAENLLQRKPFNSIVLETEVLKTTGCANGF